MKKKVKWLLPLLLFLLITPFTPFLDLFFARLFYSQGHFSHPAFFQFLYIYGEQIGFAAGVTSGIVFLFSWIIPSLKPHRAPCLAFMITLVLGAGLITNVCLKGCWGRPRPKQVIEFGGTHAYSPYYKPDFFPEVKQKSFPSGHVAMGFCYLSFVLSYRRLGKRVFYYSALGMTVLFGGGLMVARVAQGGHFVSDVLFSLLLLFYVALLSDRVVFKNLPRFIKITG